MNKQEQELALYVKRQEFYNDFCEWTNKQLLTALAIANNVVGTVGMQYNALVKESGKWKTLRRGVNFLSSLYRSGEVQVKFALTGTATMIREYWNGLASSNGDTLRKVSNWLEEMRLFQLVTPGQGKGYNSHTGKHKCREYHQINLASLLVAHEQLEEALISRGFEILPADEPIPPGMNPDFILPNHQANWGRVMFNIFFEGLAEYRRGESYGIWTEGSSAFNAIWGFTAVAGEELEPQVEEVPVPDEPCAEERCAKFQQMISQFGKGIIRMIEIAIARNPEWNLHIYEDEVVWVPF